MKATLRAASEDDIQAAVVQHLNVRGLRGLVAFAVPNGGARSRVEAAIMKSTGTVAGVPDLAIVSGGRFYSLELKTEMGRLSPAQIAMQERLRGAGANVATAYGLDDALAILESWGLIR
jgi:hypothetical protein